MAVRFTHNDGASFYFCTFTCYKWLPLIEQTKSYDAVYKWMEHLRAKGVEVVAYVIMPNHVHVLLYFRQEGVSLNGIISNAKRFLAYEIIKRLRQQGETSLLHELHHALSQRERAKGQLHRVFEQSFDAKPVHSEWFFNQKLDYIHHNPVSGKWALVDDFTTYPHSSASFYETGVSTNFTAFDYRVL
jgi:REP element-mobilizing transposase RayT